MTTSGDGHRPRMTGAMPRVSRKEHDVKTLPLCPADRWLLLGAGCYCERAAARRRLLLRAGCCSAQVAIVSRLLLGAGCYCEQAAARRRSPPPCSAQVSDPLLGAGLRPRRNRRPPGLPQRNLAETADRQVSPARPHHFPIPRATSTRGRPPIPAPFICQLPCPKTSGSRRQQAARDTASLRIRLTQ